MNPAGHPEGSVEYAQALKLHVAQAMEEEKRARVKESKEALCDVIAQEFPQHVKFLQSAGAESKEQVVQQVAQRYQVVARRVEELQAAKSNKGSVTDVC